MKKENIFINVISVFNKSLSFVKNILNNKYIKKLLKISLGVFFISLCARITFHLPFSVVPFTMQVFGVILISFLFNSKDSFIILFSYIFLGIMNFPVFSNGTFGIARVIGPTGGYIIGFLVGGFIVSILIEKGFNKNIIYQFISGLIGLSIIYFLGILRLSYFVGFHKAIKIGFYPFILPDLIKIVLAVFVYNRYRNFIIFNNIKKEIKNK